MPNTGSPYNLRYPASTDNVTVHTDLLNLATDITEGLDLKLNLAGGTLTGGLSGTTAAFSSTLSVTGQSTLDGGINLSGVGDTSSSATHYFVEVGTDGLIRPKTLADVRSEVVTNSTVNTAAATTVGTVTTGTWNGSVVAGQYGGTGVANTGKTITLGGNLTTSGAYNLTATLTGNTSITLPTSGTVAVVEQASPPGVINPYAGSSAPTGWLFCYGQAVSRTTYAALFTVLSTTYGAGDGSTTFNLPDLRGRTVAALDNMGGSDAGRLTWANTLGTASGTQTHTLEETEIPSHLHTVNPPNTTSTGESQAHTHSYANAVSYYGSVASASTGWGGDAVALRIPAGESAYQTNNGSMTSNNVGHTHNVDIAQFNSGNTGGGAAHNNMQPTMLLNYIIKT